MSLNYKSMTLLASFRCSIFLHATKPSKATVVQIDLLTSFLVIYSIFTQIKLFCITFLQTAKFQYSFMLVCKSCTENR